MAEVVSLREGVAELVRDGDAVAMRGGLHPLDPVRGRARGAASGPPRAGADPDDATSLYDQLIGMGAARKLVFSYGVNPGVGSLHRFRDAIEHGWPVPIEVEEYSHAAMANRFAASARGCRAC